MEKTLEKKTSIPCNNFLKELEQMEKVEDKLRFTLDFMQKALSSEETPAFRDFWEAKRLCLDFFKEKITTRARKIFWAEYTDLSAEARRVKEILDEEASFAHEQIHLGVQATELDLENFDAKLEEIIAVEIPAESKELQKNGAQYIEMQKELDLLNAIAERLNGFRRELINTQMRIRYKNRLFEQLKQLGDRVFPRRKEKMQELSMLFLNNIEQFLSGCKLDKGPFFGLKEEIKMLQKFAKILSISPAAFSQSRERLSGCWDQIKDQEAKLREVRAEQRERFQAELDRLIPKIDSLKEECQESKISLKEAEERVSGILEEINELKLGKDEAKNLKRRLFEAKKSLEEKEMLEKKKRQEEEELEGKRQDELLSKLLHRLTEILNQAEALSLEALVEKWESLIKEKKSLTVTGMQKAVLINRLDSIADHIQEKKWQNLLEEEDSNLASLLRSLLSERHKEKRNIKARLEEYRKLVGGSSLNLEQSMQYQELISDEKMRLDTIETMLEEIEEKLFDLEE